MVVIHIEGGWTGVEELVEEAMDNFREELGFTMPFSMLALVLGLAYASVFRN